MQQCTVTVKQYTVAPHLVYRASPTYCPKGLDTNRTQSHASCLPLQLTNQNIGITLLFSRSEEVLLSSPIECQETTVEQKLNVPVHGQFGERRLPKVQPSTRPGIKPRTSCLAVRDPQISPVALTSHIQT